MNFKLVIFIWFIFFTFSCNESNDNKKQLVEKNSVVNLSGRWVVTEDNDVNSFKDFWQISSDGFFCELKYKSDGNDKLECDESGTWKLKQNKLVIRIEEDDGVKYPKAQLVKFKVSKDNDDFLLLIINDKSNFGVNASSQILRLTKM